MSNNHYDVIIIGTGAGGGTLAHRLAPSSKKILVLERGSFLPREKANWDTVEVFQKERYHTSEVWRDKDGEEIHPGTGYWVGGNTKVYGGALFRWREKDFEKVAHKGGISPEWPLKYRDFEPYYTEAEKLYEVHGKRGSDPTEPPANEPYPFPAVSHEPRIAEIHDALEAKGLHPFHLPLAIKLNEVNRRLNACIRCDTCDGFPCLVNGKADADINCVRPSVDSYSNITLLTEAQVLRLHTSESGREVTKVEVQVGGTRTFFSADIVVVSCGAINSAVLLLRSANDKHPYGLANSSDQVGRNFMRHQNGAIVGLTRKANPTIFQKTLAVFDRLLNRWTEVLKSINCGDRILPCSLYFRKRIPIQGVAHQCGTCRFGEDPKTSVLDLDCRTHDVDNLYVVDGSFFRSSAAVNPTLTIIANALRVGDRLLERLK